MGPRAITIATKDKCNNCHFIWHVRFQLELLLFLLHFILQSGDAKSWGAPITACRSLNPAHGFLNQDSEAPYVIHASPPVIYPNQTVTVTIRVISNEYRFKGFILQAKSTEYWRKVFYPAIGTFKFTEGTRRLNCYHGEHNTLTHNHAEHTEEMTTVWMPPYKFRGRVTFTGTVVATFKVFWTKLYSNTIQVLDYPGQSSSSSNTFY